MKIVVYGATGMVGSEIAKTAVARGHEVTAVSRSGNDVLGATARAADITDTDTFLKLAASADAVVVAIPTGRTSEPTELMVDAHRRIIAAMPAARLLVVGGAGSLTVGGGRLVDAPGFPDAYRPESTAFAAILEDYKASSGLAGRTYGLCPRYGLAHRRLHHDVRLRGRDPRRARDAGAQGSPLHRRFQELTPGHLPIRTGSLPRRRVVLPAGDRVTPVRPAKGQGPSGAWSPVVPRAAGRRRHRPRARTASREPRSVRWRRTR